MRLRVGGARRALVIAPHADDETIGAFALIRPLRRPGARVRVLVVTDGAASHPASTRWPRARLVAERRRETRHGMRALGVASGDVACLGMPDGGLETAEAPHRPIARAIRLFRGFDLLVGPSMRDDHPDHRVVAQAIAAAAPGIRRLAYLVWPDRAARRSTPVCGFPVEVALAKRAAIRRYRAQTGVITDDPQGFTISRATLPVSRARSNYTRHRHGKADHA